MPTAGSDHRALSLLQRFRNRRLPIYPFADTSPERISTTEHLAEQWVALKYLMSTFDAEERRTVMVACMSLQDEDFLSVYMDDVLRQSDSLRICHRPIRSSNGNHRVTTVPSDLSWVNGLREKVAGSHPRYERIVGLVEEVATSLGHHFAAKSEHPDSWLTTWNKLQLSAPELPSVEDYHSTALNLFAICHLKRTSQSARGRFYTYHWVHAGPNAQFEVTVNEATEREIRHALEASASYELLASPERFAQHFGTVEMTPDELNGALQHTSYEARFYNLEVLGSGVRALDRALRMAPRQLDHNSPSLVSDPVLKIKANELMQNEHIKHQSAGSPPGLTHDISATSASGFSDSEPEYSATGPRIRDSDHELSLSARNRSRELGRRQKKIYRMELAQA